MESLTEPDADLALAIKDARDADAAAIPPIEPCVEALFDAGRYRVSRRLGSYRAYAVTWKETEWRREDVMLKLEEGRKWLDAKQCQGEYAHRGLRFRSRWHPVSEGESPAKALAKCLAWQLWHRRVVYGIEGHVPVDAIPPGMLSEFDSAMAAVGPWPDTPPVDDAAARGSSSLGGVSPGVADESSSWTSDTTDNPLGSDEGSGE